MAAPDVYLLSCCVTDMIDTSKIKIGDEILVKIKVDRITDLGRFCNYNMGPGGVFISRTTVSPEDVIEHIYKPIVVGDVYRWNNYDHTILAIITEKPGTQYAAVSLGGHVQMGLINLDHIYKNGTKVK